MTEGPRTTASATDGPSAFSRSLPQASSPAGPAPSSGHGSGASTAPATAPASAPRPAKQRDAFFDNAKYLAIVLVAMGHAMEPLRSGSRTVTAVYMFVYAFHMPAFIIISGYFSRNFDASPAKIKRLVTGVAVPYIVFETAYTLFTRWTDGVPDRAITLLDPLYLTWFLAALFIWRLTTPLWRIVRMPLVVALVVAMLVTLSPTVGKDLDLQRTLQFLPYFVLGLILKPAHFQFVRTRRARIAAVPVLLAGLLVAYWAEPRMNYNWFFHRTGAENLGAAGWTGPVMTLALFGCSTVLVAAFLALVPRRRMWFTALGAGTLYGYLLHGFVIQAANHWHWSAHAWTHRPLGEVVATLVAGSVVTVLCTPPVQRVFRFVMEPRMDWAFRSESAKQVQPTEPAKPADTARPAQSVGAN